MNKEEFYKWIKTAGILSFIPFILIAGPLLGYGVGDYLVKKRGASFLVLVFCLLLCAIASILESVRMIRLASKIDKKSF